MNPLTRNPAPTAPLAPCPAGGARYTEQPRTVITPMPLPTSSLVLDVWTFGISLSLLNRLT